MTTTIHLIQQDLEEFLSKTFKVDKSQVNVEIKKKSVGYGPNEHDEPYVEVEIVKEQSFDPFY